MSAMTEFFAHHSCLSTTGARSAPARKSGTSTHVMAGAKIGRGCNIGQNVVISPQVVIGDNVKIQNNVSVYTGVMLEDDVFCGPSMVFTNVINPRSHVSRKDEYRRRSSKRGATLGANSTIVCGHTIGGYAFVGAGAVVTRDVPDYALVVGNPGRVVGWMCECGVKLAGGARAPGQRRLRRVRDGVPGWKPARWRAVDRREQRPASHSARRPAANVERDRSRTVRRRALLLRSAAPDQRGRAAAPRS